MNTSLLLLLFCLVLSSCLQQGDEQSLSVDTSATNELASKPLDTGSIAINAPFPFGCEELTTLHYPKHWEADPKHYGQLREKDNAFERIQQCFNALHTAKTIKAPRPKNLELVEIGDIFKTSTNTDTLEQKSIDSCRYRLPNMGIYECYYCYARYGNLLLYHPSTQEGKLLNIFANDLGGEASTIMRFFYISSTAITLFESYCYDDGCRLDEAYTIVV